ncbi:MAG: acetylglutamate kinase [Eubacteriales bacterium]|jgi:hypothetical protein|nr:acetylglutamate kinase [Eubacteriales bacterium]
MQEMIDKRQESNYFTYTEMNFISEIRKIWLNQAMWMRSFIVSTLENLGDTMAVTKRLFENADDFNNLLKVFFGEQVAENFAGLLSNHMSNLWQLVIAEKNKDSETADKSTVALYQNADEIAAFLAQINPYWEEEKWKSLIYEHISMTIKEIELRLEGKYEEAISVYDSIEENAYLIGDYMAKGIIETFTI